MSLKPQSQNPLSKLVAQFKAWLQANEQANNPVGGNQQPSRPFDVQSRQTNAQPMAAENASTSDAQRSDEMANAQTQTRKTVDSEQYESAATVAKIKRTSTQNPTTPSPVSPREVWIPSSSVEPTPVWYKVAGYEDKAHPPQEDKDKGEQKQSQ